MSLLEEIRKIARDKEKIFAFLQDISEDEAFQLAKGMLGDPFIFGYPLQEVLTKYFSDGQEFINLLNDFIEITKGNGATNFIWEPIIKKAIEEHKITKKIIDHSPSITARILIGWIASVDPEYTIKGTLPVKSEKLMTLRAKYKNAKPKSF